MFERALTQTMRQMYRNIAAIRTGATLQYLLITVEVVAFEKKSFRDTRNPKNVFNTLTLDGKHYMLNRNNLRKPIQTQLSQKQKTFSEFFLAFLKSLLKL